MVINLNDPYYCGEKLIRDAKILSDKYKDIVYYVTIGKSHDNRDIIMLKLGKGERKIICLGGVHGRESINPIVLMKLIEEYAKSYKNKYLFTPKDGFVSEYEKTIYQYCIYDLLNVYSFLFIPLLNPDGYLIALNGFNEIKDENLRKKCKSMNTLHKEWKLNARGIDINRNFPSKLWQAKNVGDCPASENETKVLMKVFHTYKSECFVDFHSRGKEIYYYRRTMSQEYNQRQFHIATNLREITNYKLVKPELEVEINDTGGNTVHYYSEHFQNPAITIETIDENEGFPLDINLRQSTFLELKSMILELGSLLS